MRCLMLALVALPLVAADCYISAAYDRMYSLECEGAGHLSRAQILVAAGRAGFPGGAKLEAAAKLDVLRQARDTGVSRAAAAGDATWSSCASLAGLVAIKSDDPRAKAGAAGTALVCALWGVLHRRVKDDAGTVQAEAMANSGSVLPDRGIDLPWSGLLITSRQATGSYSFEVR